MAAESAMLNGGECQFDTDTAKFLGFIFHQGSISPDPAKISIVQNFPRPNTMRRLKSFLGLTNWFRTFIRNYSKICEPLRQLMKRDVRFKWSEECEHAFQTLKTALLTKPILQLPQTDKPFSIISDASLQGTAFILGQTDDQLRLVVVAYGGYALKNFNGTLRWRNWRPWQ
jgi:RNase H-like domain found in reverse transcriptase